MALLKRLSLPTMRQGSATTQSKITDVEIYFGTMFGAAEQYARALAHDVSTQRRVRVTVHDLDGFDERLLARSDRLKPTRLFVFVISTHFAGAPPPSAERFRDWINELVTMPQNDVATTAATSSPQSETSASAWLRSLYTSRRLRQPLRGMHYAVFGIGDSVYLTFNAMAKFVDLKLRQLGATRACAMGLGDCSNDLEGTFKKWEATLLRKLPARPVSPSPALGINFVSALSAATAGRRFSTASFPNTLASVAPAAGNTSTTGTSTGTGIATHATPQRAKSRVAPHPHQEKHHSPSSSSPIDPNDAGDAHDDGISKLTMRDNFGRTVRLRFHVLLLDSDDDDNNAADPSQSSTVTSTVAPTGPRTPRVALFDTTPFAEIEAIEIIGDVAPSSGTSPTPPPAASSLSSVLSPSPSSQRTQPHHHNSQQHHYTANAPWSRAATFRVRLLNPDISYVTVSTLAIFPQNTADHVEQIAEAFGYDLDAVIHLRVDDPAGSNENDSLGFHARQHELPFPTPCTIRTALTEFIDLRTITRELLHVAAGFVVTTDEHESLERLACADNAAAFKTQIQDPHKGLVDLLELAPTLQIPLEVFVSIMPILRPRYYTVASSPRVAPRELDLAVSLGRVGQPQGFAVSFFEQVLTAHRPVPLRGFISHSRFQFPDDGVSPMVLIAMGVSVSAMRAIIQDRLMRWFQNQATGGAAGGGGGAGGGRPQLAPSHPKHLLFLGAANEDTVVFRDDLRYWEQQLFAKVYYAFSSDPRAPRQYIQDVVVTRMDEIFQAVHLSANSRIFVCGRVSMVRRVREIFETDQARRGNMWFDTIHSSGRFIDEGFN